MTFEKRQTVAVIDDARVNLQVIQGRRTRSSRKKRAAAAAFVVALCIVADPRHLSAQSRLDLGGFIEVGSETERYMRVLQISGVIPFTPWSIQPFTPTQARKFRANRAHPWSARFDTTDGVSIAPGAHLLRARGRVVANSAYPYQDVGGPAWAGRGFTGGLQGGIGGAWGLITGQLAPLAFIAQNASFTLAPNGRLGDTVFADARFPANIDAPQRFGTGAYKRFVPGTSFLAVDEGHVFIGTLSAPQQWGPARDYPLVLGPNAGGFPAIYAGTSRPVNLWLIDVHARVVYGDLGQSALSAPVAGERRRLGSGAVGVIGIRGAPGLEIGGARFIHQPWPSDGLSFAQLKHPLIAGTNFGGNTPNSLEENQVASIFARWAFPSARFEVYGEMYREDYPGKFHRAASIVEKPDDLASFTIGLQRVLALSNSTARVIRAELVNGETSHQERGARGFDEPLPPYIHTGVTQGHTVDGLILGSPEAYGGAAWRVGYDEYSVNGRMSLSLERSLRFDWLPTEPTTGAMPHPDVIYALRADLVRFSGKNDFTVTLIPALDLNRNLVPGNNVFNLTAAVTLRGLP